MIIEAENYEFESQNGVKTFSQNLKIDPKFTEIGPFQIKFTT